MMTKEYVAVICALNSKYIHSALAPWYLAAGIEKYGNQGIRACVIEGTINEKAEDVVRRIVDAAPDVVGFCCYIWNIGAVKNMVRIVKEHLPHAIIVFGGPEVSYNADEVLREEPLVDYVISGEGEKPFAHLLNILERGMPVSDMPGVSYRDGSHIVLSDPYTTEEEPPSPYSDAYFDTTQGRIAYFESSRGCPYSCAFCLSGRCGGARFFDLQRTKSDLLRLANSGTRTVKFVDRTFNCNRPRAAELLQFIIVNWGDAIPKGVCFHFEIAGDLLDEKTLVILESAPPGLIQLEIGLQSFNSATLTAINRKTDTRKLVENIGRLTKNTNIHTHIDLIAGLPYEDLMHFEESFNKAYELGSNMLQLGFLKLLHGAPMRENPEEFPCEYDRNPPYEVISTPWLTSEDLLLLHQTEDALERLYNSGRFRRTLGYLLQLPGQTPFRLFADCGGQLATVGCDRISLDDFTALVYPIFCSIHGTDPSKLRDFMVCDRLATNSSGKLPSVLRIADPALRAAINAVESDPAKRPQKGIRRGYALLYSERCLVYADYKDRDMVSGEYALTKHPIV